jgi:hypothetical protein
VIHWCNIIAAVVGYLVVGGCSLYFFAYVYWHTHCTACYIIAELRVLYWRRAGQVRVYPIRWWLTPRIFCQEWWRGWNDHWFGARGSGGEESTVTWEGVATWHGPNHIFSLGRLVWHQERTSHE